MKDKLEKAYNILSSMSVCGDNQEKIVAVKQIIRELFNEPEHEYSTKD